MQSLRSLVGSDWSISGGELYTQCVETLDVFSEIPRFGGRVDMNMLVDFKVTFTARLFMSSNLIVAQ